MAKAKNQAPKRHKSDGYPDIINIAAEQFLKVLEEEEEEQEQEEQEVDEGKEAGKLASTERIKMFCSVLFVLSGARAASRQHLSEKFLLERVFRHTPHHPPVGMVGSHQH